jgi:FKBP-type peptidyl-prolyl cis-trans isomerase FkpA
MLKKLLSGIVLMVIIAGCSADDPCETDPCDVQAPPSEVVNVETYLANNNITGAVKHCSGLYYIVDSMGTGPAISPCNGVQTTYVGALTNGVRFDSGTIAINLSQVIRGWTVGIPLVKGGGTIRLFIPPTLGYGSTANGPIPASSILVFKVKVDGVY